MGSAKEILKKAQLYKTEDVLDEIRFYSNGNEHITINLTSVKLLRINYPFNCFTLDLTNNTDVQRKGVKQLFYIFPIIENSSVSVLPQGKSLVCNREIKAHKLFSSGADLKLINLGLIKL